MTKLILIAFALAIIVIVIKKFFPDVFSEISDTKKKPLYKYNKKDFIMTRAEHEFFDILVEVVENKYYVFPQIHLSAILDNKVVGQNWKGALSHINQKSVDFVICDKAYLKPLIAIELDDKSHEKDDRVKRDTEVESIFNDAGLTLLRFNNNGSFNKEEIKSSVLGKL